MHADFLCNEMKRFKLNDIEFYLPQICNLLLTRSNHPQPVEEYSTTFYALIASRVCLNAFGTVGYSTFAATRCTLRSASTSSFMLLSRITSVKILPVLAFSSDTSLNSF